MNEKKEKCIIFALAGILLLIVCIPTGEKGGKKEKEKSIFSSYTADYKAVTDTGTEEVSNINNGSFLKQKREDKKAEDGVRLSGKEENDYVRAMEDQLKTLLQHMDGVGKAEVMITLRATKEEIVEKDRPANRSSVTEQDGEGGSRSSNDMDSEEATVYVTDAEGNKVPYVRKVMQPVVEGVAVLAEGGDKEAVKRNISEAVQALFGLDANKIKIAKMKTEK